MLKNEIQAEAVDAKKRNCYCFLWHEDRKLLESQRLTYGYCGVCEICGEQGHTRHAPSGPSTSSWCDECWSKMLKDIKY